MDLSSGVSGGIVRLVRARLYYPRLMSRLFEKVTLADAVGHLRPGMKVLLPAGCGDPAALLAEILRQADRLAPLTLMGGLRLDDYPFAASEYAGKLRFATWHHSPKLAQAQARGDVDFVPIRYFETVGVFVEGGAWAPDAVVVHASPADGAGYLSLGVSVSYSLAAARRAPLVIAQVNPRMPRTLGNAFLHRSQIDCWVEVDHPLAEYPPTPVGDVERGIAGRVADIVHDPRVVGTLGHFVSVNSAIEVDLLGQVNAESVEGQQVTGIGGQFDFVLGARQAAGGRSVIALPSTGRQGKVSRIVARLPAGARVTTPRFLADYVVTEWGMASLRGQSDAGRARELCRVADPAFRESLEREAATS